MKTVRIICLLFFLLTSSWAAASPMPLEEAPAPCKSMDLTAVPVGVKCVTSKGTVYERVSHGKFGEAWKGPDGLIWSDRMGVYQQNAASSACQSLGGALASKADFERIESSGLNEVLPNLNNENIWTSTLDRDNPNRAYYYFSGKFGILDRFYIFNCLAYYCVAR